MQELVSEPDQITAWLVELPLLSPFSSAASDLGSRRIVVVRLRTGDQEGWGEAAPVPGHSAEDVDVIWDSLRRSVSSHGLASPPASVGMLGAAFRQAETDLVARLAGRPLWQHLGGSTDVVASAAIGLDPSGQPDRAQLDSVASAGYRRAKLKISRNTDLAVVESVVEDFPGIAFGADANGSLDLGNETKLAHLDEIGLSYIEQPGPADDLDRHRTLRTKMSTPIALDESARSPAAIESILRKEAADIINLKTGRFGPVLTLRLAETIKAAGSSSRLGGLIESGIGRGHTIALATHELFDGGDIAGSDQYFADDLVRPQWRLSDGHLRPSNAPGLGVEVDAAALARLATQSVTVD